MRVSKQLLIEWGTFSQDIGLILEETSRDWKKISAAVILGGLGKATASTMWGQCLNCPRRCIEEGRKRLRAVGKLEWICSIKSEHPWEIYVPWESPGDSPFTKTLKWEGHQHHCEALSVEQGWHRRASCTAGWWGSEVSEVRDQHLTSRRLQLPSQQARSKGNVRGLTNKDLWRWFKVCSLPMGKTEEQPWRMMLNLSPHGLLFLSSSDCSIYSSTLSSILTGWLFTGTVARPAVMYGSPYC